MAAEIRAWVRDVGFPAAIALYVLIQLHTDIVQIRNAIDSVVVNTAIIAERTHTTLTPNNPGG